MLFKTIILPQVNIILKIDVEYKMRKTSKSYNSKDINIIQNKKNSTFNNSQKHPDRIDSEVKNDSKQTLQQNENKIDIINQEKKENDFPNEEIITHESTDRNENKINFSTDKENANKQVRKKNTCNDTTLYLVNNFKELKDLFPYNDTFNSQLYNSNKSNFLNSFDLDIYGEDNNSFEVINIFDNDESNSKYESNKIGTIFDKKNDVSIITQDNENIEYICSNLLRSSGFIPAKDKLKINFRILQNVTELEAYLKIMIEANKNENQREKNTHLGFTNNKFDCTVKLFRFELKNINENYFKFNYNHKKHLEIIDPEQFNLIIKTMYVEINHKTIDLGEHYKNLRRKLFDDELTKKNEYINLIKEYFVKKANIFNEKCREFIDKLNISKKILFESFIFFILKKNYNTNPHTNTYQSSEENMNISKNSSNFNNSILDSIFNSKKYDNYIKVFSSNNLFDKIEISNIDEIITNIILLNFVGIKE